jgi:shikimate dehydrogenase
MMDRPLPFLAGLIGWPVHQSKSPLVHGFWLEKTGIDGHYVRLPVRPGAVEAAFRGMVDLGFAGVQATMPHKRDCFRAVDRLTPIAQALGAVNTVVVQPDGSLLGHNTDIGGFAEPLVGTDLSGQTVTVLGAGGAAAAIIVALASKGPARINLVNRSAVGIDSLLKDVGGSLDGIELVTGDWLKVDQFAKESRLIANATSLGMTGQPDLPVNVASLPDDAIMYDIVTHPHETAVLKAAKARGLTCYDGMHMLVGQAREAFSLFYGVNAPSTYDDELRGLLTR